MRERQWLSIFPATKPTATRGAFDCRDSGVAKNNFCRFISHCQRETTKMRADRPLSVGRLWPCPSSPHFLVAKKEKRRGADDSNYQHSGIVADEIGINH